MIIKKVLDKCKVVLYNGGIHNDMEIYQAMSQKLGQNQRPHL